MILALSVLFIVISAQAQVYITNAMSVPLEVRANKGQTIINPNQVAAVNFVAPNEKGVKFNCGYYEGDKMRTFSVTTDIIGEKITLSPNTPSNLNRQAVDAPVVTDLNLDDFLLTSASFPVGLQQTVVLINSSGKKFIVNSGGSPFAGISLAPNDTSSAIKLPPGLYQFTVIVDNDQADKSTGKNFSEAVIKFILAQGETEVNIAESNVTLIGGDIAKVILTSDFSDKIVFVGSTLNGRAMQANSSLRGKVKLTIGFNSLSIQFYYKGSKYQADLEFIVAEGERRVVIGKNNFRNIIKMY